MKTVFDIIEIFLAVVIPLLLVAVIWETIPRTVKKQWRYYWTETRGRR